MRYKYAICALGLAVLLLRLDLLHLRDQGAVLRLHVRDVALELLQELLVLVQLVRVLLLLLLQALELVAKRLDREQDLGVLELALEPERERTECIYECIYVYLCVFMCGFMCIHVYFCGFMWICVDLCGFTCIFVDLCGFA